MEGASQGSVQGRAGGLSHPPAPRAGDARTSGSNRTQAASLAGQSGGPPHTVAGVPRTGQVPCRVPVPRGAAAAICELRAQAGGWSRCGKVLWLALDARLIRSEHVLTAPRELLGAHAEESPAF